MSLFPSLSLFSSPFISNTYTQTLQYTHYVVMSCWLYVSLVFFFCADCQSFINTDLARVLLKNNNFGTNIGSCPTVLSLSHAGHAEQITQYEFSAPSPELLTPALPTLPLSHTHNPVSHTHAHWMSLPSLNSDNNMTIFPWQKLPY